MMFCSVFMHSIHKPLVQMVLFLLLTFLAIPFLRLKSANAIWNVAGIFYVGFIVANAVLLWGAEGMWTYFFTSMAFSLLYIGAAGVLIPLTARVMKLQGTGESAMIFIMIIYHPFALLLMILVKWIVGLWVLS